ncbi:MAG: hypothetical protein WCD35_05805, partial [Mycobacteriales bacterium]
MPATGEDEVRAAQAASRVGAVVVLTTCLGTGLLGVPAFATPATGTATPPAVTTNWYWAETTPNVQGNTLPAGAPAQASGVPDGDLGVGYTTDVDKVAAVAFDLGSVPLGSTFSRFTVTVPLDSAATQVANGNPDLSACEAIDSFTGAAGPTDYAQAPPISTPSCVKGTFKASVGKAGGYVFELAAVANDWSGGAPANGIVLRPTTDGATAPQPFSLSLLGKNDISTDAAYTTPETPVVAPPAAAQPPAAAPPPVLPG